MPKLATTDRFGPVTSREDWELSGTQKMTDKQRRMLNACCGDLAKQVVWSDGQRLSCDDFRHMLAGTMLGWRMMRGIDRGEGSPGLIMLGGSSLDLTRTMAADAITCALHIGDHPEAQGLSCKPVQWCDAVLLGLGLNPNEMRGTV